MSRPRAQYLIPGFAYRNSLAKVFGGPGSTKSFLILDAALSLATGTPWFGQQMPQMRVDYVMAEGEAVNVARTEAWFHDRGVDPAVGLGWFRAIPQGVLLTDAGIAEYLEQVRAAQPALIILDTKNRMMAGEENSASDVAVMVRAMDQLRQAGGQDGSGATVVLIDHTGLMDPTRGRGSNAVEAAMDTEIRVARQDDGSIVAEVTRDKAAEVGRQWTYRLASVDLGGSDGGVWGGGNSDSDEQRPAVVRPVAAEQASPFLRDEAWWLIELPENLPVLPSNVAGNAARSIVRLLLAINGDDGLSKPQLVTQLGENRGQTFGRSTVYAAVAMLKKMGILEPITTSTVDLAEAYRPTRNGA
jgi:hypothetical protein